MKPRNRLVSIVRFLRKQVHIDSVVFKSEFVRMIDLTHLL